MAGTKIPQSVLVIIHSPGMNILLLERADHAGFWQSVTGSLDAIDEPKISAAYRELFEETGITPDMPGVAPMVDWKFSQTYEIYPHWRHRYPEGVTENVEHVFSIEVPQDILVKLSPREHTQYRWLPWGQATQACFSWSNATAITDLVKRVRPGHPIRVATYNIHKGQRRNLPGFRKELRIHDLQEAVGALQADIICLQEVQGRNDRGPLRYQDWPAHGQHEFLAPAGYHVAYASAANYLHGHHGNALITRFPIAFTETRDFSDHALEKRATLHAVIKVHQELVHVFVVHFGLFAASRRRQLLALIDWVNQVAPADQPVIIAGDFNDWRLALGNRLISSLSVIDVTRAGRRLPIRTFPSFLPMMHMDRIFQRGFDIQSVGSAGQISPTIHSSRSWSRLSDHVPIIADLRRLEFS